MLTIRLSIIIGLISFVFLSCKKDQTNFQRGTLKMISIKSGDSIFYRSFQYDNQNTLIAIFDSNNSGYKKSYIITYDGIGNVQNVATETSTYTFEFDNNGGISKKSSIGTGQQIATVENTYRYDNKGRLSVDSVYDYWTKSVDRTISYLYDQNNNVVESKTVDKVSGGLLLQKQCTFDNHTNPHEGNKILTFILSNDFEIPLHGKNNLLKETYQDGTIVNYSYEYDNTGLPKKCSIQDNFDPLVTVIDYFYE